MESYVPFHQEIQEPYSTPWLFHGGDLLLVGPVKFYIKHLLVDLCPQIHKVLDLFHDAQPLLAHAGREVGPEPDAQDSFLENNKRYSLL